MPMTPSERELVGKLEKIHAVLPDHFRVEAIPELCRIVRRLDRESRRQRKSIAHVKSWIRAFEGR